MISIAVLGYGTVGSGVVEVLEKNKDVINQRAGDEISVKYVLDLRDFMGDPIQEKIVHDIDVIINDPEVQIVVEVMGGVEPAYTFVKRCLEAAEVAQATEFIDTKPEKYESPVSQGGTNVSGGQKQRLSIARAIAKDPEIFIFDDSFSALDFKTDSQLRKALKEYTKDATTVIVAQRISTILGADQIIVLDDGHMAGIGTHKELMANCEVYQQIARSQLSEEELA